MPINHQEAASFHQAVSERKSYSFVFACAGFELQPHCLAVVNVL